MLIEMLIPLVAASRAAEAPTTAAEAAALLLPLLLPEAPVVGLARALARWLELASECWPEVTMSNPMPRAA